DQNPAGLDGQPLQPGFEAFLPRNHIKSDSRYEAAEEDDHVWCFVQGCVNTRYFDNANVGQKVPFLDGGVSYR
ncbi:MAG: hypothetical protein J5I41_01865, partial [Saprospiraceae bacterium]|nr:hypothetical protein [Saprospiraceae bacterium]